LRSLSPEEAMALQIVLQSLLTHGDEVVREQAAWSLQQG
jgi:hypothetical protein